MYIHAKKESCTNARQQTSHKHIYMRGKKSGVVVAWHVQPVDLSRAHAKQARWMDFPDTHTLANTQMQKRTHRLIYICKIKTCIRPIMQAHTSTPHIYRARSRLHSYFEVVESFLTWSSWLTSPAAGSPSADAMVGAFDASS